MQFEESFDYVIGVDVSKVKLDIALPKELMTIENNTKIIQQLVDRMKSDSVIVVMEATGGYENQLVQAFHKHGIALAVVNPRRVRDFAKGIGKDAKTDPIDARVIAYYREIVKPAPQFAKSDDQKKLGALVERRRQLLGLIGQEKNRLHQVDDADVGKLIEKSLEMQKSSSKSWMSDSPKRSRNLRPAINARSKFLNQRKGLVPSRSVPSWPNCPSLAN